MKVSHLFLAAILVVGLVTTSLVVVRPEGAEAAKVAISSGDTNPSAAPKPLYSVDGRVPSGFSLGSSASVRGEGICVVGAVGDEDGMNRRPFVYFKNAPNDDLRWTRELGIPDRYYEGRATHCLSDGGFIYVLIHVETHSQRTMAQTLLHVVKLTIEGGRVESNVEVPVPGAKDAYSQWVHDDDFGFRKLGSRLLVTGMYRYKDSDEDRPFSAIVDM